MMLLLLLMTMVIPLQYATSCQYCTVYIAYSGCAVIVIGCSIGPILSFVICCFYHCRQSNKIIVVSVAIRIIDDGVYSSCFRVVNRTAADVVD